MNTFNDPVSIQGGVLACDGATMSLQRPDDEKMDLVVKHLFADAVYLTSDRNKKKFLEPLVEDAVFDQLIPYKYKLNDKIHYGLLLENCPAEIACDGRLDYNSIIAILLARLKSLEKRVSELESHK